MRYLRVVMTAVFWDVLVLVGPISSPFNEFPWTLILIGISWLLALPLLVVMFCLRRRRNVV